MSETKRRAKYTLEFKLEAVRLVKGGQVASRNGKDTGHPQGDLGELGQAQQQGPTQGRGRQAGEPRANGTCPIEG